MGVYMSYNKVILIGNLGKDPESKAFSPESTVTNFTLATTYGHGDKATTEWHNIQAWDKTGQLCQDFLKKGSRCMVEGRIKTRTWEKDGEKKYATDIVAEKVVFLSSKQEKEEAPSYDRSKIKETRTSYGTLTDDIPF
jgi:single-strand DNA-binding protein